MRIGVVGSGISGLSAAWLLSKKHEVTLFEKEARVGGHSNTVTVTHEGLKIPVDTGFIVFNKKTYPHLIRLFDHLRVPYHSSDMSFGVAARHLEYSGRNLSGVFAQKSNLFKPDFWQMLWDIFRFNKRSIRVNPQDFSLSLEDYVTQCGVGRYFKDYYLYPMVSAIWSTPRDQMKHYPAASFLAFFQNHGLLQVMNQPQWYTVTGGSQSYVKKLLQEFKGTVRMGEGAKKVFKKENKILVKTSRNTYAFDHVVMATHGDEAAEILENLPQSTILKQFQYTRNMAYLHSDPSFMPRARTAWASWIYALEESDSQNLSQKTTTLTYWMNLLQLPKVELPLFVTLNPLRIPKKIHYQTTYTHPVYGAQSLKAQEDVRSIQGQDNIWFCGAYLGYGFHEDGLRSGLEVCSRLGVETPWDISRDGGL